MRTSQSQHSEASRALLLEKPVQVPSTGLQISKGQSSIQNAQGQISNLQLPCHKPSSQLGSSCGIELFQQPRKDTCSDQRKGSRCSSIVKSKGQDSNFSGRSSGYEGDEENSNANLMELNTRKKSSKIHTTSLLATSSLDLYKKRPLSPTVKAKHAGARK
ncbi:protein TNT [Suncus etruscus]|uniref:protein TNT n=1 Tax=Suncus etruscus TaxID=109475 RepID=UPI00210FAA40|nr:protein TNT [Suncus etruscus]